MAENRAFEYLRRRPDLQKGSLFPRLEREARSCNEPSQCSFLIVALGTTDLHQALLSAGGPRRLDVFLAYADVCMAMASTNDQIRGLTADCGSSSV